MIFFFYGPNSYAARRKLQDMAIAYIAKAGSDFGLERIDGAEVSADKIMSALQASPFLANSRLVIIENLGANKLAAEKLPPFLDQVPETTVAVFYEPEADQRTSYFKTMSKHPKIKAVKYDKLSQAQLTGWAKRQIANLGGSIDNVALNLLVELTGDDQWRLEQEINKLVNYDAHVSVESVKLLVDQNQSESIFDLVEAMSSGNLKKALATYQRLLEDRTSEIYILTMVTWQLRNLLLAKTAGSISSAELASRAGMSPYVAGKAQAKQREFDEDQLKQAFTQAVETDFAIKSGKGKPDQLVEQLIYKVATARG